MSYSPLEYKDYVKYLGMLIDKNLNWKGHIDLIALKTSMTIGVIAKLLNLYQAAHWIQVFLLSLRPLHQGVRSMVVLIIEKTYRRTSVPFALIISHPLHTKRAFLFSLALKIRRICSFRSSNCVVTN